MTQVFRVTALGLILGMVTGCTSPSPPEPKTDNPLQVTVSIAPQVYFVDRIGGDKVAVNAMIPPGIDPHTYEPKPDQLKTTATSKAYFKIGVSLEDAWKDRLTSVNPRMLLVDTGQGVEKIPLTAEHHDHEKETLDPHIWLSPKRVKIQAKTIYQTLARLDPSHQATYKANFDRFLRDIDALDREIRQTLSGVKQKKFMVFHPEWGYFAKDYGLEMISIEVEGNEPSAAELSHLITEARENQIKVIFAQPEFSRKSAETIAREIGGQVILISAFDENWSENLRQVSQKMAKVLNQ